jgi:outer membrane protein OmpA-like peptidoglycan-associated protein
MDAGALINLQMQNHYTAQSSFDNEAIYQFKNNDAGGKTSVYDNATVPSADDWLITKAQFLKNNPNGSYADYVNAKRALGFNVGEGLNPTNKTGKTSYNRASVGLLIQPSLNYFLSDMVALNFGMYYMFQPFKNDAQPGYRLTDGNGGYSSVLNSVTTAKNDAYGINIGVRFFLGKKKKPLEITAIEQTIPSQCGLCDGGLAISGLFPNQPVTVGYTFNGGQPTSFSSTVQPDGKVNIGNLCAGSYTAINVRIKRSSADGKPVTISAPVLRISSQSKMNPGMAGVCDGSIKFNGLHAGNSVTINYDLNGSAQSAYTGTVTSDNSVTINGLCEGTYTGIMLTCNTCTTKGDDFTLNAPPPPPPPPVVVVEEKETEENSTVLFDFDKSVIKKQYYHVLDHAIAEIKEDGYIYIKIDGYTDYIGTDNYNQKLSQRRAMAVTKYFVAHGVKKSHIKVSAHGEKQPAESNATAEGSKENRRVVIVAGK